MSEKLISDFGDQETEELNIKDLCTIYENFRQPGIRKELESMG